MVACLAHLSIKLKELKFLMDKIYTLQTFDLFCVYVVLKYALVILDDFLSSCDLCENEFSYAKKKSDHKLLC